MSYLDKESGQIILTESDKVNLKRTNAKIMQKDTPWANRMMTWIKEGKLQDNEAEF